MLNPAGAVVASGTVREGLPVTSRWGRAKTAEVVANKVINNLNILKEVGVVGRS